MKRLYRAPFDVVEEWTMAAADGVVVNSAFTEKVVRRVFPSVGGAGRALTVVYPCVDVLAGESAWGEKVRALGDGDGVGKSELWKGKKVVLSINRFERKKGVELAVKAFAGLAAEVRTTSRLVIAGMYLRFLDLMHSQRNHPRH